jgi:2-oxoisovalerate dehydrogenase E1 component alpha subunit
MGMGLIPDDSLIYQYREHGISFYRGMSKKIFIDALHGNKDDMIKGKWLAMIFSHKGINLTPNSAPLGAKIPHGAGFGYFYRTHNQNKVALTIMGDGSAS